MESTEPEGLELCNMLLLSRETYLNQYYLLKCQGEKELLGSSMYFSRAQNNIILTIVSLKFLIISRL